jgi:hypothetical protein
MNLCEKSGVSANIYAGFMLFKKHGNFRGVKKLFVLQAVAAVFAFDNIGLAWRSSENDGPPIGNKK